MAKLPVLAPGLRQTRQRQLVWEALRHLGGHCTAHQITVEIQREQPGFSRSTVYRALEALTRSGLLHAVRLGDGPVHYEIASEEHQHAICQICESIFHIEHDLVRQIEEHLERLHHFTPVRTEVLVVGVCEACTRSRTRRPARRPTVEHPARHPPPASEIPEPA